MFSGIGCLVLFGVNILFIPKFSYIACAWAGFAGYGVAMVLSYFVGQKKYPIKYPLKDIALYVSLAVILFAGMSFTNAHLGSLTAIVLNTIMILAFCAVIIKRDFPLSSMPVVGKYFKKDKMS